MTTANFGVTSLVGYADDGDGDIGYYSGFLVTAPDSGVLKSLSIYCSSSDGGAGHYRLGLYATSGGVPTTVLAQSNASLNLTNSTWITYSQ